MNKQMLQILSKLNHDLVFLDKSAIIENKFKTVRQLIEEFKSNEVDDTKFYELKNMELTRGRFKLIIINNDTGVGSDILFMEMD